MVDDASDAAMAVLTVHHWDNVEAGIAELRRIARRRIVIFTFDPLMTAQYWLVREYLPQLPTTDPLDRLVAALDEDCSSVTPVPIPHDCTDGFAAAGADPPPISTRPSAPGCRCSRPPTRTLLLPAWTTWRAIWTVVPGRPATLTSLASVSSTSATASSLPT